MDKTAQLNLLGFLDHSKEIICLGDILEFQTKLVNNDEALVMSDSPGGGGDTRYKDLARDAAGVEAPGLIVI